MKEREPRLCCPFPFLRHVPLEAEWERVFGRLFGLLQAALRAGAHVHGGPHKPVLVVNRDTIDFGVFDAFCRFLDLKREPQLLDRFEIVRVRAVDTCQMWISGLDVALDGLADDDFVLHIPGDLKDVGRGRGGEAEFDEFLQKMGELWPQLAHCDFVVGDFEAEQSSAKVLIDLHGVLPLLGNWFPEVERALRDKRIKRPRSEFFAARANFLRKMLLRRKFAFEQTLAFLIYAMKGFERPAERDWKVKSFDIGPLADHAAHRGVLEGINQIERTELMLRVLWRELNASDLAFPGGGLAQFEQLDRRSTAIREAAMIILSNSIAAMPPAARASAD